MQDGDRTAADVVFRTDPQQCSLTDALFVQEIVRKGAPLVRSISWPTEATDVGTVTDDERFDVKTVVEHSFGSSALVCHGASTVALSIGHGTFQARIAGEEHDVESTAEVLTFLVPNQPRRELEVPISFWLWTQQGPQQIVRQLSVKAWPDISANYSHGTRAVLDPSGQQLPAGRRWAAPAVARRAGHRQDVRYQGSRLGMAELVRLSLHRRPRQVLRARRLHDGRVAPGPRVGTGPG